MGEQTFVLSERAPKSTAKYSNKRFNLPIFLFSGERLGKKVVKNRKKVEENGRKWLTREKFRDTINPQRGKEGYDEQFVRIEYTDRR